MKKGVPEQGSCAERQGQSRKSPLRLGTRLLRGQLPRQNPRGHQVRASGADCRAIPDLPDMPV